MKQVKNKISNCKGETLVEVLASILIATLAVAMLVSAVMVTSNMNKAAEQADDRFYQDLTNAEIKETPIAAGSTERKAILSENTVQKEIVVDLYGGEGVYSYQEKGDG